MRHESFACAAFVALRRKYKVAIIAGCDSEFPCIADFSADFVYVRAMGTVEKEKMVYSKAAIAAWAVRAQVWEAGVAPIDLPLLVKPVAKKRHDVFLFVISGFKARNPAAAQAIIAVL